MGNSNLNFVLRKYMDWAAVLAQGPVLAATLRAADASSASALLRSCRRLAASARGSAEIRLAVWILRARKAFAQYAWDLESAALRLAAGGNDVYVVRLLMRRDLAGLTAPLPSDKLILEYFPDHVGPSHAERALIEAARLGALDVVRLLREEYGVGLNPLALQAGLPYPRVTQYMIDSGVEIGPPEVDLAIKHSDVDSLRIFYNARAEIDGSLFPVTILYGGLGVITFLVEEVGLRPGLAELRMAEQYGLPAVVDYLRGVVNNDVSGSS